MQLKNTITLCFEPYALKTKNQKCHHLKNEPIFAIIHSINELQHCNNHKSPTGNNRKT